MTERAANGRELFDNVRKMLKSYLRSFRLVQAIDCVLAQIARERGLEWRQIRTSLVRLRVHSLAGATASWAQDLEWLA